MISDASLILKHNRLFLVDTYARNGKGAEAIGTYRLIPGKVRDVVSHRCVLNACSQSGLIPEARSIFNLIETKTETIFTAMVYSLKNYIYLSRRKLISIDCLARACLLDEAQQLLHIYERSHPPSSIMYSEWLFFSIVGFASRLSSKWRCCPGLETTDKQFYREICMIE